MFLVQSNCYSQGKLYSVGKSIAENWSYFYGVFLVKLYMHGGLFLTFSKKLKPEKNQQPKKSTIFQAKTQRTGSNSSHMNFKTHFIFSTFAVNEQKSFSISAKRTKICHIWCIFTQFSTKNSHFFKKITLNLQNFRVFE